MNDKIKVFDSDENKLKILGELLSNDTSRRMIKLLIEQESYTNQIAKLLDIRVSLVIHHLKKMEEIGILEIHNKKIVKKGKEHRYFRMVPGLFVLLNQTKGEIKEKGILKNIFKEGIKFASIAIGAFSTYFIMASQVVENKIIDPPFFVAEDLSDEIINYTNIPIEHVNEIDFSLIGIVVAILISTNLFVMWFTKKYR